VTARLLRVPSSKIQELSSKIPACLSWCCLSVTLTYAGRRARHSHSQTASSLIVRWGAAMRATCAMDRSATRSMRRQSPGNLAAQHARHARAPWCDLPVSVAASVCVAGPIVFTAVGILPVRWTVDSGCVGNGALMCMRRVDATERRRQKARFDNWAGASMKLPLTLRSHGCLI